VSSVLRVIFADAALNCRYIDYNRITARIRRTRPILYKSKENQAAQAYVYCVSLQAAITAFTSFAKGYRKSRASADRKCLARDGIP
jgi:hypothetical protein